MSRRETLRSAYLYSVASTGLIALTGVATGIVSSRVLGPVGRGQLTALLLIPTLVGKLGNVGFIQAVAYLDNPFRSSGRVLAGTALTVAFWSGVAIWLGLLPLLSWLLPNLPKEMLFGAALCLTYVPVNFVFTVLLGAELAEGRFRTYNILQAACGVGQIAFVLMFLLIGLKSPPVFGLAIVLAVIPILLLRAPALFQMLRTADNSKAALKTVAFKSLELTRPEIAGLLLLRCDQFLLVCLGSSEELGLYTVVIALAFGHALTAGPLSQTSFHLTSSATSPLTGIDLLARQFRLFQIFFLLLAATTFAAAPFVIHVAFGDRYMGSVTAARILILGMAIWSCSQTLEGGMRGMGFAGLCSRSNLMGMVTVLVLGVSLAGRLGIVGIALSALAGQTVALGLKLFLLRRRVGCRVRNFWAFGFRGINEFAVAAASLMQIFGESSMALRRASGRYIRFVLKQPCV